MRLLQIVCIVVGLLLPAISLAAEPDTKSKSFRMPSQTAAKAGREFLVRLFDEDLKLLPEFHGHHVYWLYHDNYLAAKVLSKSHPKIAKQISEAIRQQGERKSGKIEILFGEVKRPLPFRSFRLMDVKRMADGKLIRTERVTDKLMRGWEAYADLLFLAAIAEQDQNLAKKHFAAGIAMWDGKGISDAATKAHKIYPTYKLALAILAAKKIGPAALKQIPDELIKKLLGMQAKESHMQGGWITDYKPDGKPIGKANVETSCMAILALECLAENRKPSKD